MSTFLVASWNNEKTQVKLPFRAGHKSLLQALFFQMYMASTVMTKVKQKQSSLYESLFSLYVQLYGTLPCIDGLEDTSVVFSGMETKKRGKYTLLKKIQRSSID